VALIDTEHAGRQSLRVGVGELQVIAAASAGHPQEVFRQHAPISATEQQKHGE
jgi:hypothetical protein